MSAAQHSRTWKTFDTLGRMVAISAIKWQYSIIFLDGINFKRPLAFPVVLFDTLCVADAHTCKNEYLKINVKHLNIV